MIVECVLGFVMEQVYDEKVVMCMCTIFVAFQTHPEYPLIVAANRDEFYHRPTAPAHFWEDTPNVLAGRDLEKRGTWLGVTKTGRFAALTNFRTPNEKTKGKRSRGELVTNVLNSNRQIEHILKDIKEKDSRYPGYNLLAGNHEELYYYSNVKKELQRLEPGIYGLSNHLLNTDWPKVTAGKKEFAQILSTPPGEMTEQLFRLLRNTTTYPDELLPNTGVSLRLERILSSIFIKSEDYGTRSSTVLFMNKEKVEFVERNYSNQTVEVVNEHKYCYFLK